jgi:hypothetical protein
MTVYVVQNQEKIVNGEKVPKNNITPAAAFGELVELAPPAPSMNRIPPFILQKIERALFAFNPEEDFLLPVGDPLLIATATAFLGRRFDSFRILKWNRKTASYSSHIVTI